MKTLFRSALWLLVVLPLSGWASDVIPDCLNKGRVLPVDNEQVISWKQIVANGQKRRAHIEGVITRIWPDRTNHKHFEIKIGSQPADVIEVVYNLNFGSVPPIRENMRVEACGEYITSNAPNGGYSASPSGAIIHWIHRSSNVKSHDSGFMVIDGVLYGVGYGKPKAKPRNPRFFVEWAEQY